MQDNNSGGNMKPSAQEEIIYTRPAVPHWYYWWDINLCGVLTFYRTPVDPLTGEDENAPIKGMRGITFRTFSGEVQCVWFKDGVLRDEKFAQLQWLTAPPAVPVQNKTKGE